MRLAFVCSPALRTPPRAYGPWEQFGSLLTEALIARGVEVTLFATADSMTSGRLDAVVPHPLREHKTMDEGSWVLLHMSNFLEKANKFDLIHNNFDITPLSFSRVINTPMITTIHGLPHPDGMRVYERFQEGGHYVAVSQDAAQRLKPVAIEKVIYHGIDVSQFPAGEGRGGYLLFFARIVPEKGAYEAIQVARKSKRRLLIAGPIDDENYFRKKVEPYLSEDIVYIGNVNMDDRAELLGNAEALLQMINFDEPFGFSVVEAQACGTPVIATNRGSMAEILSDGETGFLVGGVSEAVEAVNHLPRIQRAACRSRVERLFTVEKMANEYIMLYKELLG